MAQPAPLIDSHCHFDFSDFDRDRALVWQRCQNLNIEALLIPGVEPGQWPVARDLCLAHPGWRYAVGLHPWYSEVYLQHNSLAQLKHSLLSAARDKLCVAVGECGLDKLKGMDMQLQRQILQLHIDVATQLNKPLILHCVKAHEQLLAELKATPPPAGAVLHAFSGSVQLARQYVALGLVLGAGGVFTYERAKKTRQAFAEIPLDNIVLETDAPAMAPSWVGRGQRNSPEHVAEIARALAELRGQPEDEIRRRCSDNCRRLFAF
ncbi:TatD family hydrolase [Agaribacterium haliotis]|uniref:TatD family hydrolase n=1 Tax=Agaribacterium haliotis TaxID=2013869 RepID=UPI0013047A14|nr:TatD family hydrolase [Agaribacterium haliotis]